MKHQDLKITKSREYVWRTQLGGQFAWHNYIDAWNVVDGEGNIVEGGAVSGNNCNSGYAVLPRKKYAQAWILGYTGEELDSEDREMMAWYREGLYRREHELRHTAE